ncbi:response regulator [Methylobacterium mesophilicum SR1.6/6]|uniref:Response regulator n=1 Tax=Methylobacterium mesophilicum SR1.6/6 TaxID=908290 RepID=A0A6B9FX61_9HYPH|nr:transcriptional regulator [Methylobacterium mesophilicum]QGY05204.1 response regulator [Methylobacterium mesophilicum SR1.6/6]
MPDPVRPLAGYRILVVEDEYLIAIELKRWLKAAGACVAGPLPSVVQALAFIEEDSLAAAVLDVNLGHGETVHPLVAVLGSPGVPYLFATGDVKLPDADGYRDPPRLTKPYHEAELVHAVATLILGCRPAS